jgi:hypothetical protein
VCNRCRGSIILKTKWRGTPRRQLSHTPRFLTWSTTVVSVGNLGQINTGFKLTDSPIHWHSRLVSARGERVQCSKIDNSMQQSAMQARRLFPTSDSQKSSWMAGAQNGSSSHRNRWFTPM